MQYGRTLDRLLHKIVFAELSLVCVYLLKADVSDRFYLIGLLPEDAPNLGLIFPNGSDEESIVTIPLTLPMGWNPPPPLLCTATETVVNIVHESLRSHQPSRPHNIDDREEAVAPPPEPTLAAEHTQLTRNPYLRRPKAKLLVYVDVFVDNFLGLAQGPRHRHCHVRRTLFHALDKVFRTIDRQDTKQHKEVLSLNKLEAGDCPCL